MTYRRITALDPLTEDVLGELPDAIKLSTVRNLYGLPTGQIVYPSEGTNRTLLNSPVEIKVERVLGDGTTEEGWNSRYLLASTPDNDEYTDGASKTYNLIGMRWRLSTAPILTPSASQEPDGTPVKQVRRWTNKNPGAILGDIFNEVQALGFLPGLTKDFGFVNDSAGVPWDAVDDIIPFLEWPIESSFESLVTELEVRQGRIETVFNGREWRVFRARTHMYRDLTVGSAPVGFFWGPQNGITKATEAIDYLGTTTDGLVVGADGKTFTPHNFGSDGHAYYGPTMRGLNVPWAHNADMAKASADSMFRAGARERKEITVEVDFDSSLVEPDRDVRLGDRVFVQKGDNPVDADGASNVGEQRIVVIQETDGEKRTGSFTFESKLMRLETLTAQLANRLAAAADVSPAGASRPPGVDEREPTAPTGLTVTTTNEADESGRQRANHFLSWAHDGNAIPDPITGQIDPIQIKRFEIEFKNDETDQEWQHWRGVPGDHTSIRLKGLAAGMAADSSYVVRVRAIPYTGVTPSAWVTSSTITVPADLDALQGASLIWDAGHRNAAVRAKRKSDAGGSFDWVSESGEYVAKFVATDTVDYGVGPKLKSFRRACEEGDVIVADAQYKRQAGTTAVGRQAIRFFDKGGSTLGSDVTQDTTAGASYATSTAFTATAPFGAASFTVRVKAQTLTGTGAELRVRNVTAYRRVDEPRQGTDSVVARVVHATDNLTSKHTSTGAFVRAASGSGFQASPTGFYFVSGGVNVVSFDSGGIYIKGTVETSSGLILGGAGLEDIVFPGGQTIGEAGGYLEYTAGGSGHKFTGNMIVSGGVALSSTLQVSGATDLQGDAKLGGSGQVVGFYGNSGHSFEAVNSTPLVTLANVITVLTSVRTIGSNKHFW